ncbi:MAG: hypothetical protein D6743_08940 [Calditrichaeota bacterium]|nr:MAG: hypothetical protein D6743_08940 [Calditrichota bacterium]
MSKNGKQKGNGVPTGDAQERLRAALAISKLLKLYGVYAEVYGFDNTIMEAGIQALNCELEAVLALLAERKRTRKRRKRKKVT